MTLVHPSDKHLTITEMGFNKPSSKADSVAYRSISWLTITPNLPIAYQSHRNTAFPNNTTDFWIPLISASLEAITEVIALRKGDFADESQKTAHHQCNLATEPPRHLILCETITSFAISLKSIKRASERLENVLESPNRCIAYLSHY